jgi:hypothetical protein
MPSTPDSTHPEPGGRPPLTAWPAWVDLVRPHIHRYAHAALWLIAAVTVFRLGFATQIELVGDEAYYWLWSQRLDISYFSKGPGVAWTIAAGTFLWGDNVFGVRFFAVLLSAGTAWGMFVLARLLFSPRVAYWSLVAALGVPLLSIGSILMTIDPLSVFFWTWAAVAFWHAREDTRLRWWVASGALVGLGMLCKYTNVAELICFTLFLALQPRRRSSFLRPGFWLMLATAALSLTPIILWNARHQWITFQHLWHRGALDRPWRFDLGEAWDFVLSQFLVASPFLALGLLAALVWVVRRGLNEPAHRESWTYLLCLWLPLVVFYLVLSFNDTAEANWTAPSFVAGSIVLVAVWQRWMDVSHLARRLAWSGLGVSLAACIFLHVAAMVPTGIAPLDRLFARTQAARDLAVQTSQLQQQHGASFLIANKYPTASLISFYHPRQPRTYLPRDPQRRNQFSFWPDYTDGFNGETALFITDSDEVPPSLGEDFARVELLGTLTTRHRGRDVRTFHVHLCHEYGMGPRFQSKAEAPPPAQIP